MELSVKIKKEMHKQMSKKRLVFNALFRYYQGALEDCLTHEEVLTAKRALLIAILDELPITGRTCSYCSANRTNYGTVNCDVCEFAEKKKHQCDNAYSDWRQVRQTVLELKSVIAKCYNMDSSKREVV